MGLPTLISRTSPFPILGASDGYFQFLSNIYSTFCKQTVDTLIRRHVCICPTKRTQGLFDLIWDNYQSRLQHFKHMNAYNNIMPHCLQYRFCQPSKKTLVVVGINRLFAYCKGGNFNIRIWAWFDYFIC